MTKPFDDARRPLILPRKLTTRPYETSHNGLYILLLLPQSARESLFVTEFGTFDTSDRPRHNLKHDCQEEPGIEQIVDVLNRLNEVSIFMIRLSLPTYVRTGIDRETCEQRRRMSFQRRCC